MCHSICFSHLGSHGPDWTHRSPNVSMIYIIFFYNIESVLNASPIFGSTLRRPASEAIKVNKDLKPEVLEVNSSEACTLSDFDPYSFKRVEFAYVSPQECTL